MRAVKAAAICQLSTNEGLRWLRVSSPAGCDGAGGIHAAAVSLVSSLASRSSASVGCCSCRCEFVDSGDDVLNSSEAAVARTGGDRDGGAGSWKVELVFVAAAAINSVNMVSVEEYGDTVESSSAVLVADKRRSASAMESGADGCFFLAGGGGNWNPLAALRSGTLAARCKRCAAPAPCRDAQSRICSKFSQHKVLRRLLRFVAHHT